MDLRAKNEQFLMDHVRSKCPSEDMFNDVYGEAWVFCGEKIDGEDLTEETQLMEALDKHLQKYLKDAFGFSSRTNEVPLDDVIRSLSARQSSQPGVADESWEAEASSYEYAKEELRRLLPPLEYEALEMHTQIKDEQRPVLTIGFTPQGLQMLLRRALIRKLWAKED